MLPAMSCEVVLGSLNAWPTFVHALPFVGFLQEDLSAASVALVRAGHAIGPAVLASGLIAHSGAATASLAGRPACALQDLKRTLSSSQRLRACSSAAARQKPKAASGKNAEHVGAWTLTRREEPPDEQQALDSSAYDL